MTDATPLAKVLLPKLPTLTGPELVKAWAEDMAAAIRAAVAEPGPVRDEMLAAAAGEVQFENAYDFIAFDAGEVSADGCHADTGEWVIVTYTTDYKPGTSDVGIALRSMAGRASQQSVGGLYVQAVSLSPTTARLIAAQLLKAAMEVDELEAETASSLAAPSEPQP